MIDFRFFKNGWRFGVGPFFIRWNRQDTYCEFCCGRVTKTEFRQIGGMTWREWHLAKAQARIDKVNRKVTP